VATNAPCLVDDLGPLHRTALWFFKHVICANLRGPRMTAEQTTAVFRIVQEALSNVVQHAKADRVSVQLTIDLEKLRVVISDNGVGFNMEQVLHNPEKWDHFGVRGIVERAKLVGGEATIDSKKGRGTQIVVEVPLVKKERVDDGEN